MTVSSTKSDKLSHIVLGVFRLNGELVEWGNHFARPQGITTARWQVLGGIQLATGDEPPSIPQIAATMGITRQGVLKQINLLVAEGLVQAQPNPHHRRSPLYTLTEAGQRVVQILDQRWNDHLQPVVDAFSDEELDTALRVIGALSKHHAPD